jgi:hypothetical protein
MALFEIKQVGETVSTIYRELFTIKFTHAGFENLHENFLSQGISIVPDQQTEQLFIDHKVSYRFYTNTLVGFMECSLFNPPTLEPKVPFIHIDGDLHMRFLVKASEDFASKTYVVSAGSRHTYHFTNKINNASGGFTFLTAPVENHSLAKDYEVGTVVKSGLNLFDCIKTALAADNIAISNTTFWEQLDPVEQVVNNADLEDTMTVNPDSTCFAVIDLFKNGTLNSSYKIFDINDQLFNPAPVFSIKFKSRI